MCWLKRDMWKAGIAIVGMLILLVLMVWVPVSAARAYEHASGLATPTTGTVQATPTVDPTMTALQKEQLTLQNNKLKNDNAWAWLSPLSALGPIATIIAGLFAALYSFTTWIRNRQDEQKKQAEERFQKVVEGLGSERTEAKAGAAITLRTFLQPGYERFYRQTFDLAVAHLRLRKADASTHRTLSRLWVLLRGSNATPTASIPHDSLSQALITVFKESFPLARNELKKELEKTNARFDPQQLDASGILLDHAYLVNTDLAEAWLVQASLREADLYRAKLEGAHLEDAHLKKAHLEGAKLQGAHFFAAQLQGAHFFAAQLEDADIRWAQLQGADLSYAQLQGADLSYAQIQGADLYRSHLEGAHL